MRLRGRWGGWGGKESGREVRGRRVRCEHFKFRGAQKKRGA